MPARRIPSIDGHLLEVFSSIQGEGGLVGCRQIFIRMAGCNLSCAYCDTDFSAVGHCRIEDAPGSGQFRNVPSPVSVELLGGIISDWVRRSPGMHHSISLTGGEPLVQSETLREWAPVLRDILPLHLETNGTCPDALEPLVPHLDWISMDVKLASMTGVETPWELHRSFLKIATGTHVWVKAIVGEETPAGEMALLGRMVHRIAPECVVYLQPVTRRDRRMIPADHLLGLQAALSKEHAAVRVVPQTHVFLNLI